ncbi:MAG: efflux RND transporter periplasmic adaptor subunit [Ignavibacteriae bacterium]|nr:efflux RND transporter periplasmic adaptor subunit [Ignavibacteriota bacterium]
MNKLENNFLNSIKYFAVMIFLLIAIASCNNDEVKTENTNEVEAPPSISEKKSNKVKFIELDQAQISELKISTKLITKEIATHILSVPGFVFPAPENISIISAPLDGRVAKIYAHEGENIRKGQVLLELESIEYGNLVAEYLQTNADKTYQENKLTRIKLLVEKKISSKSDLDKAEAEFTRANAALRAAYSKLKAVGTSEKEISNFINSSSINPSLKIIAPINGTIDQHLIDLGQSVIAYDKMLSIIDLSKVLVRGYVSPEDGANVKAGNKIKVSQKNNVLNFVEGNISTINPALDETNKSIVINSILDTKNNWPKPGENLKVDINIVSPEPIISIPLSAIAYDGDESVVFVKATETRFEQRPVILKRIYESSAIVSAGLYEDEEIAVNQIFSLKALLRFEDYADE